MPYRCRRCGQGTPIALNDGVCPACDATLTAEQACRHLHVVERVCHACLTMLPPAERLRVRRGGFPDGP